MKTLEITLKLTKSLPENQIPNTVAQVNKLLTVIDDAGFDLKSIKADHKHYVTFSVRQTPPKEAFDGEEVQRRTGRPPTGESYNPR